MNSALCFNDSHVENAGRDDEESEENNLDDETTRDDIFSQLDFRSGFGLSEHSTTTGLHQERKNIAGDEYFGEPARANDGIFFTVGEHNDTSEDHVDGCCEEGGGDEDEKRLHDVGSECPITVVLARR